MNTPLPPAASRIFVVWFGPEMSGNRLHGLRSIEEVSELPVEVVTDDNLDKWVVEDHPLHPAFRYLTAVQKADYLRSYLLHHHGGGYSDIKTTLSSWRPALAALNSASDRLGVGYREIGRNGVAELGLGLTRRWEVRPLSGTWWRYRWLQLNYSQLLGNGAYVFKAGSSFTFEWLSGVESRLDGYLPLLEINPGRNPKERPGVRYDFGISQYPITWSAICADVFHPLCLKYRRHLLYNLPAPSLEDYE